jgi:uncharacterized repeat protein (TIGR01451 family)
MTRKTRVFVTAAIAIGCTAALPSSALALIVATTGNDLDAVTSGPAPTEVTVSLGDFTALLPGTEYRVVNATADADPATKGGDTDCRDTQDDAGIPQNTVYCDDLDTGGASVTRVDFDGGPASDHVTIDSSLPSTTTSDLRGSGLSDVFNGGAGADTMDGGSGLDTLNGGGNADDLDGGVDISVDGLNGDAGDDTLRSGNDGADNIDGGGHATLGDTVNYAGTSVAVNVSFDATANDGASGENDSLTGVENATGSSFNDTLTGDGGNNRLHGGALGVDTIAGGPTATNHGPDGSDTLTVTGGDDRVSYAGRTDDLTVDISDTTDNGGPTGGAAEDDVSGFANVTGGNGDDDLIGTSAQNQINGGAGDDHLRGGPGGSGSDGADSFTGGSHGTFGGDNDDDGDYVSYFLRTDPIVTDLGPGSNEDSDTYNGIENLTGGSNDDQLTGDGGPNEINGGQGDDLVTGAGGSDSLFGFTGDDDLQADDGVADAVLDCGTDVTADSVTYDTGLETPNVNCENQTGVSVPPADISLAMSANSPTAPAGQQVTFTLTVSTTANATGVVITDVLPAGISYVSDSGPYDPATDQWSAGSVAPGSPESVTITVTRDTAADVQNSAEVTASDQPDPDSTPGNGVTTEDDYATVTLTTASSGGGTTAGAPPTLAENAICDSLRAKLRKAKRKGDSAKVRKLRRKLRANGC